MFKYMPKSGPFLLCLMLLLCLGACAENPEVTRLKNTLEDTSLPTDQRRDAVRELVRKYASSEMPYLKKAYLTLNDPRYDQAVKGTMSTWLMFHDYTLVEFLVTPYIEGTVDQTPFPPGYNRAERLYGLHNLYNATFNQGGWGHTDEENQKRFDFYRRDLLGEFPYKHPTYSAKTLFFSYSITEEEHPDLFAAIRKEIRAGNLSIPGLLHGSSLGGVSKEKRKMLTELIMEKIISTGEMDSGDLRSLPLEERLPLWEPLMEIVEQQYAKDPEGFAKCSSCTDFHYNTDPERTKPFLLKLLREHHSNGAAAKLLRFNDPAIDKEIGAMIQEVIQTKSPDLELERFCQKIADLADTRVFSQEFYVQQMLGQNGGYSPSARVALQKYPDPFDAKTLRRLYKHRPERAYIKAFERLPDTPENALFLADIALANKLNTGASHARGILRKWKYKWKGDCWEKDGKTILCRGDSNQ